MQLGIVIPEEGDLCLLLSGEEIAQVSTGEPPLNSGVNVCGCHTARNILTTGGCSHLLRNSRRSIKLDGKAEPKGTKRVKPVRYTAAKLHDKGVLLGIDDLQTNQ